MGVGCKECIGTDGLSVLLGRGVQKSVTNKRLDQACLPCALLNLANNWIVCRVSHGLCMSLNTGERGVVFVVVCAPGGAGEA
jgi:hypothetical protein